jgi:hypothetical protein
LLLQLPHLYSLDDKPVSLRRLICIELRKTIQARVLALWQRAASEDMHHTFMTLLGSEVRLPVDWQCCAH